MIDKKLKEDFVRRCMEEIKTQFSHTSESTKLEKNKIAASKNSNSVWMVDSSGEVFIIEGAEND